MNRNCDECKFEHTPANSHPCCGCMDFEHTQWQPKETYQNFIVPPTYTREEVLELMHEARTEGCKEYCGEYNIDNETVLDNFDKLKNQKK